MKKIKIFTLVMLVALTNTFAVTKTWTNAAGGTWSVGSNWSGGTAPTSLDDVVFDGISGTITLDVAASVNSLDIKNSSNIVFTASATRTFTINGSAATSNIDALSTLTVGNSGTAVTLAVTNALNFNVYGSLVFGGTAASRLNNSGGVTTIYGLLKYTGSSGNTGLTAATQLVIANNGTYEINKNGGTLPTATYQTNSLLKITGMTVSGIAWNNTPTYGNIEWNNPGQTAATSIVLNITCNNLNIVNDGTGELRLVAAGTASTMNVNGNLTIGSGTSLNLSNGSANGTMKVKGNVIVNGTITETNTSLASTLELNGAALQELSVAGTIANDVNLKIANTSGGVKLLTDVTLSNSNNAKLNLTSGIVDGNNFSIYLQNPNSAALVGGGATSYLANGRFRRAMNVSLGTYLFPIGTTGKFRGIKLYPATAAGDDFTAEYKTGAYPNLTVTSYSPAKFVSAAEYWDITRNAGSSTMDISLLTDNDAASTLVTAQLANAELMHFNGSTWDALGNNSGNTTYGASGSEITTTGYSGAFSPFSIGGVLGVLPVDLTSFEGAYTKNKVVLNFTTATESNSAFFEIERSADAKNFERIGRLNTAGTTTETQRYEFTDLAPNKGLNYYRLKQVDIDGRFEYSKIISIVGKNDKINVNVTNCTANGICLNIQSTNAENAMITLYDVSGRMVFSQNTDLLENSNLVEINQNLQQGIYILRVNTVSGQQVSKVVGIK